MLRQTSSAVRMLALAAAFALPTVGLAQDNRPVVVVFRFDNNSIGASRSEYDGVQTGLQDLLITDLASNAKIRLVDRAHLNEILTEQKMAKDGQVDPTTAVKLGKILGAQYAVTGGFMSDGKGKLRLTGRTIDVETTQIINPATIDGKADDVLAALTQLSTKVASGMNLAPKPGGARRGETGEAAKTEPAKNAPAQSGASTKTAPAASANATEQYRKPLDNPSSMKVQLDAPTLKIYSAALDEMDKKNNAQAIKLLKQVTTKFPGFEPAERNLKKLGAA